MNTPELFEQFLAELKKQKRFAFDTETDALGAMASSLVGMSFSWKPQTGLVRRGRWPSGQRFSIARQAMALLRPILENPKIKKIGHNIKYDHPGDAAGRR